MREIKFRGFDKDGNIIIGNLVIDYKGDCFILDDRFDKVIFVTNVGQYTGLVDFKEKEIYEGDIVKVNTSHLAFGGIYIKKVIWGMKGSWHPENTLCDNLWEFLYDINGHNCSEVIGNIYENEDLL